MYGTAGAKGAGAKETFIPAIAHGGTLEPAPGPALLAHAGDQGNDDVNL